MNDNEIIKGFAVCNDLENGACEKCPYDRGVYDNSCLDDMKTDVYNLINRQKAEIERLTSTQEILQKRLDNCLHFAEENVEFEKENRDLLLRLKQCDTEIESLKIPLEVSMAKLGDARAELQKAEEEIERKDRIIKSYALRYGTTTDKEVILWKARAKAIMEFAERLKAKRGLYGEIWESDIDKTVEEMTEATP